MTDWPEAGRKAWATRQLNDAHQVRDLCRSQFVSSAKSVARHRSIDALHAAGVTTVLDLWGGGLSALELVAAGFRVISVDDGSMEIRDTRGKVSTARKRRALEMAGAEGGYETRWGPAARFTGEADGALLDFCGPWSKPVREAIVACRSMKAVVVTLMTDHDISTDATSQQDRLVMYQSVLKYHFRESGTRAAITTPCRLLCHYKRPGGQPVWVFLMGRKRIPFRQLSWEEQRTLHPERLERARLYSKARWANDPEYRAQQKSRNNAPEKRARENARARAKWHDDPEYRARKKADSARARAARKVRQAEAE